MPALSNEAGYEGNANELTLTGSMRPIAEIGAVIRIPTLAVENNSPSPSGTFTLPTSAVPEKIELANSGASQKQNITAIGIVFFIVNYPL